MNMNPQTQQPEPADAVNGESPTIARMAQAILSARAACKEANASKLRADGELEAAESVFMEELSRMGLSSITTPDGKFSVRSRNYYGFPSKSEPEKRESVMEWLKTVPGGEEVISVNHQAFGKFCRELSEHGIEMHADLKTFTRWGVEVRAGKED